MTKISTLYDSFSSFIDAAINDGLTGSDRYIKIPNPYTMLDNPEIILNKSYGIAFLDGLPFEEGSIGCQIAMQRDFEFSILRHITASDYDSASRNTIEKSMFEDQFKVIKAIENDVTINESVSNTAYQSDSGLLFLSGEDIPERFFLLTTIFTVTYFENLST